MNGASITFSGETGAGNYVLATAASGLDSFTFSGSAPSGYAFKPSSTQLNLQHKATTTLALGSNANSVHIGSQTVNLSIGNSAPSGSAELSYTLDGIAGSAGTRTAGTTNAATGTYTAGIGSNSFNITVNDSNATNPSQSVPFSQTGYQLASTDFNTTSVDLGLIHVGGTFGSSALSLSNTRVSGTYNEALGAVLANASGVSASGGQVTVAAGAAADTSLSLSLTNSAAGHRSGTVDVQFDSQAVNGSGLGSTALTALNKTVTVTGAVFNGTGVWSGAGNAWGSNSQWADSNTVQAAPGTFAGYDNVDTASFTGTGTSTVNLDGVTPSLKSLTLSGATAYTVAQGTGGASLQFKSDSGNATLTASSTGHSISAPVTLASNLTTTVITSNHTLTLSNAISGGSNGLAKSGAGTLVLSGSNTYTGETAVSNGKLLVNNSSGSGTGSGAVSVTSGATLGGTGALIGAVTITGGTLSPGASVESFSTGAVTFDGGTFEYETNHSADSAAAGDLLIANGNLTLTGTVNLTLTDLVCWAINSYS